VRRGLLAVGALAVLSLAGCQKSDCDRYADAVRKPLGNISDIKGKLEALGGETQIEAKDYAKRLNDDVVTPLNADIDLLRRATPHAELEAANQDLIDALQKWDDALTSVESAVQSTPPDGAAIAAAQQAAQEAAQAYQDAEERIRNTCGWHGGSDTPDAQ
jgi:hypothetical protein